MKLGGGNSGFLAGRIKLINVFKNKTKMNSIFLNNAEKKIIFVFKSKDDFSNIKINSSKNTKKQNTKNSNIRILINVNVIVNYHSDFAVFLEKV